MTMLRFLLVFQILLFAAAMRAQPMEGDKYVRAELITDAGDFTKPFSVGIKFTMDPGWYVYWKNPGDAGLSIAVLWDLPRGWKASDIKYPTPKKVSSDNIVAYGYKDEVILLATIIPGPDGTAGLIKAKLDWLVCKESCVRGTAEVSLPLRQQLEQQRKQAHDDLQRFRQRLPVTPEKSEIVFERPRVKKTDGGIIISVEFKGDRAGTVIDFFPESVKDLYIEFASIHVSKGILYLKVSSKSSLRTVLLKGLLVTREKSYECVIPIEIS